MIYKTAKEAGAMAAVLEGRVDALVLTGGMAHSNRLVTRLRAYIEFIAPVTVYPGEDELLALAEGVFPVLDGEEQPKVFHPAHAQEKHRDALVLGLE
jgi:butyrate kinase